MKPSKVKDTPNAVVPARDRAEAEQMIRRIGELMRALTVSQAALDEAVAKVKAEAEAHAKPLQAEQDALIARVQAWADANRAALTGGRTKTVALATGEICWRQNPPSVSLRNVKAVLAELKKRRLKAFIRVREEVDKAAMLADPKRAAKVPGVTIQDGPEMFVVIPAQLTLSPATPALVEGARP